LPEGHTRPPAPLLDTIAKRLATIGRHRDLTAIPQLLVRDGFAVWFGEPFRLDGRRPPDELAEVAARIVALAETHRIGVAPVQQATGLDPQKPAAAP
jgi:hypothetical protein